MHEVLNISGSPKLHSLILPAKMKNITRDNLLKIKTMSKADLEMVMGWANEEQWEPGKFEAKALYNIDPHGYNLLTLNDKPIASLAAVKHSSEYGFLGLYIVKKEYRGKGYGKILWDVAIKRLKSCDVIELNGVLEQTKNYTKEAFEIDTINTRWSGVPSQAIIKQTLKHFNLSNLTINKDYSLTELLDYDEKVTGLTRRTFLINWINMPESHLLIAKKDKTICGYGLLSKTQNGYKIAPLFANNLEIARILFAKLCEYKENDSSLHIDTNENNESAITLIEQFQLKKVFNTQRMYYKGKARYLQNNSQIFGLTSLEVG